MNIGDRLEIPNGALYRFNYASEEPSKWLREGDADLVFADPPYNIGVEFADDPTGDNLSREDYLATTRRWIRHLRTWARPDATFWWMVPEQWGDDVGPILTEEVGPRLFRIVWYEAFARYQGDRGLTKDYRFIFCHRVHCASRSTGAVTFNPHAIRIRSARQEQGDKRANPLGRVPGCVWSVRRLQGTSGDRVDWHKTQLPPELLERIVNGWSNPGDLVIDGFAGSGSLGVCCKRLGRRFVGIDNSPTYLAKIKERLA